MPTSTLSEVKLRSEVDMMRTSRSNTISSIGRRSVRDETRADDLLHPAAILAAGGTFVEAEQAVDFGLVQHARGLRRLNLVTRGLATRGLCAPRRSQFFVGLRFVGCVAHWTSIWVNRTSVMRAGAAARLARAISSSRRR